MSTLLPRIKVIHPFHPLFNKEFELISFINSWKKECVKCLDENGSEITLPLDWTDASGIDPFVHLSKGRSHFRVEELLRLAELIAAIARHEASPDPVKV